MIHTSSSTCLHIQDGEIKASAHKLIVSHSPQGEAVLDLKFGGLQFSIFPGQRAGELAEALLAAAVELAAVAEEVGATKVLALSD